jgi:alkylhydroperoxidase/carboxymuconolactone decarboxylase family protein
MNYYESKDLARFGDVGKFRKELMDKFFDYYGAATGTDGALTKREKSLIGLAIAHFQQCPYCIDAYTQQCLETGANPDQMTEAIHVAGALAAGMTLVHGVQMQNILLKHDAM